MGIKLANVKSGVQSRPGVLCRIDNPYSHLAASIIIQAFEDLKALDGDKKRRIDSEYVWETEIMKFLRSEWCGLLLSCQSAITQENIEATAEAILKY